MEAAQHDRESKEHNQEECMSMCISCCRIEFTSKGSDERYRFKKFVKVTLYVSCNSRSQLCTNAHEQAGSARASFLCLFRCCCRLCLLLLQFCECLLSILICRRLRHTMLGVVLWIAQDARSIREQENSRISETLDIQSSFRRHPQ
jgi:hypothetical protein